MLELKSLKNVGSEEKQGILNENWKHEEALKDFGNY